MRTRWPRRPGRWDRPSRAPVLADDLVALDVLAGTDGVDAERLGAFGFSGGGGRGLLLAALDQRVAACVVSCMMATFDSLVPAGLDAHSWLLHVPGLWSLTDWPDLTGLGRARFLVQYRTGDELFPLAGMEAAHAHLLQRHHGNDGDTAVPSRPGGHAFDAAMQEEAWAFLAGTGCNGDDLGSAVRTGRPHDQCGNLKQPGPHRGHGEV